MIWVILLMFIFCGLLVIGLEARAAFKRGPQPDYEDEVTVTGVYPVCPHGYVNWGQCRKCR